MNINQYRELYGDSNAVPGWDAIDSRLKEVYGSQEPRHWGTLIKAMLGGPDPIDGISAYESQPGGISHLHFCTYGYSERYYNEEAVGKNFSGFGFEMTFRLASPLPPKEEPAWVLNLLQNLARTYSNRATRLGSITGFQLMAQSGWNMRPISSDWHSCLTRNYHLSNRLMAWLSSFKHLGLRAPSLPL